MRKIRDSKGGEGDEEGVKREGKGERSIFSAGYGPIGFSPGRFSRIANSRDNEIDC